MKPLARRDGLLIRDLAGETLVYDRERHQAHCLNPMAAAVFRLCDGVHSADEIASLLDEPLDPRVREAIVASSLEQLAEARLLADVASVPPAPAAPVTPETEDPSRRELLRRVGTALIVPAIASIVAPTPAQAASACFTNSQCLTSLPDAACKPCEYGCDGTYVCDELGGGCVSYVGSGCP